MPVRVKCEKRWFVLITFQWFGVFNLAFIHYKKRQRTKRFPPLKSMSQTWRDRSPPDKQKSAVSHMQTGRRGFFYGSLRWQSGLTNDIILKAIWATESRYSGVASPQTVTAGRLLMDALRRQRGKYKATTVFLVPAADTPAVTPIFFQSDGLSHHPCLTLPYSPAEVRLIWSQGWSSNANQIPAMLAALEDTS